MRNKLYLILLLGAFLRLFMLADNPPSLNWDETSMGYTAYSLLETGRDEWGEKLPIFFRSYGEWKSAVYIYVLIPFVKLLGLNAWAVRLPSALAGVLSIYLTYLVTRKIFNEKGALWASLLLSISPWHIMLSRPAFEANFSLMLMLLGIYNLISYSEKKVTSQLIISSLAFGLAPHTYNSAKIITPFLVVWLIYKLKNKLSIKAIAMYLFILAVFAIPIALNIVEGRAQHRYSQVGITTDQTLTSQFYEFRRTFPFGEANKFVFNKYTFFIVKFADNWLSYFSPNFLLTEGGDHNQHSIPYFGVLYIGEFILLLIGFTKLSRTKHSLRFLPAVIILLGFTPAATTRESHHVLRSILTLPGWQILAGYGASLLPAMNNSLYKFVRYAIGLQATIFVFLYFAWYPKAFARDWQYGYKEAIEYAASQKNFDKVVMTKWYGEPQVFVAFYTKWDPAEYQKLTKDLLRYETEDKLWVDQLEEYSVGKYSFKYLEWPESDKSTSTLYIGKFDDFYQDSDYVGTIYFPDGSVAFHLVGGGQ